LLTQARLADLELRSTAECTGRLGAGGLSVARATRTAGRPGNLVKLLVAASQRGHDVPGNDRLQQAMHSAAEAARTASVCFSAWISFS
jgi:hypothetical protein